MSKANKLTSRPSLKTEESEEKLCTKEEIADFLSVSVKTIDRWVSEGTIPNMKIGGMVRFSKKRVLESAEIRGLQAG